MAWQLDAGWVATRWLRSRGRGRMGTSSCSARTCGEANRAKRVQRSGLSPIARCSTAWPWQSRGAAFTVTEKRQGARGQQCCTHVHGHIGGEGTRRALKASPLPHACTCATATRVARPRRRDERDDEVRCKERSQRLGLVLGLPGGVRGCTGTRVCARARACAYRSHGHGSDRNGVSDTTTGKANTRKEKGWRAGLRTW